MAGKPADPPCRAPGHGWGAGGRLRRSDAPGRPPGSRSDRLSRGRGGTRPDGHAVGPFFRLGHRRHPARRPGGGLAGQRLGPELFPSCRHARHGGRRGSSRPVVPGAAGLAGNGRRRCCHRSDHGQLRRPVRCLVGQDRHDAIDLALRYLGLGRPVVVPSDQQGRLDPAELDCALPAVFPCGQR